MNDDGLRRCARAEDWIAKHPQIVVEHDGAAIPIDIDLAPLVKELWRAKLYTNNSCQDFGGTGQAWIEFRDPMTVASFLNRAIPQDVAPGSLWRRASDWGLADGDLVHSARAHEGGDWDYQVTVNDTLFDKARQKFTYGKRGFLLSISVRFPRSDIAALTANLKRYNDTGQYP